MLVPNINFITMIVLRQLKNYYRSLFQENHVNLVHIESRKSKRRNSEFEIFVDCDSNHEQLNEIIHLLRKHVNVVAMEPPDNSCLHEDGMKSCRHSITSTTLHYAKITQFLLLSS